MSYTRINWTDTASTPLCADNLNTMENGIEDAHNGISKLNTNYSQIADRISAQDTIIPALKNFTGANIMKNNKNYTSTTDYADMDGAALTTDNACLHIAVNALGKIAGAYGKLSKTITLDTDRVRQALVKLRVKAANPTRIYPVMRLNANGTYIGDAHIVSSNLTSLSSTAQKTYWEIPKDTWCDLWLVFGADTTTAESINEIGVFVQGYQGTTTTVSVQQFDVFYNMD